MEEFIETNLMEGIIGMNKMYLLHFVFGSTPYYIIIFLIVKRGGVDVSIINGLQRSLTLYEHEPFS